MARGLDRVVGDRERQFWLLQVMGWGAYFAAAYIGALAYEKPSSYLMLLAGAAVMGFVLSIGLRYVYRRIWQGSPWMVVSVGLLACYVLGLVWSVGKNLIYWKLYKLDYVPDSLMVYFHGTMTSTYVLICWSGLYIGIKYYQLLQDQRQQTLRANALAHEAQLKMLRYQLNPHFLFNTLNAISTLILDRDNETANRAVTRLSDFLRYTLHNDPLKKISLEQELKSLSLYLEIEKVRFQERLGVELDVGEKASKALVPSLITQPIIENAIKYAVAPREEGGHIRITAHVIQERLVMELEDDGPGLNGEEGKKEGRGVGLRNTRERLQQMYGDEYSFELTRAQPTGLRVIIAIPYET
ncbi:MAG: histidine kinase [Gammaproteobacteria bacterium SG8_31]|jgi:two-component system LytT family sensor kinase|nr:MAG: histidine kinase [Gammaproteobacteria bacterium SG8_31]